MDENKQLITVAHLKAFKDDLLFELKMLLRTSTKGNAKQWMKSREVRNLLDVSPGTLQTMRKQKTIAFKKIGGTIYYDRDKVNAMFEMDKETSLGKSS